MASMTKNSTISDMVDYYIVCSLSFGFGSLSVIISILIVTFIARSRSQLHTVRHLLIANTCIGSIVYCLGQTTNYLFLIFFPGITSDFGCRLRGYFSYMSIAVATYSYLIQTISRLFFSVLSTRYPWLTTFKTHFLLIYTQWLISFIVPLSAIITNDIFYRPGHLCWITMKSFIHVMYVFVGCYAGPVIAVLIIYIYIYKHIQELAKQTRHTHSMNSDKRDLQVLRNIAILLSIYISGGVPMLTFLLTNYFLLYLVGMVAFTAAILVEKLCTIGLDREIRSVVRSLISSRDRVMPFETAGTPFGHQPNQTRLQRLTY